MEQVNMSKIINYLTILGLLILLSVFSLITGFETGYSCLAGET